MWETPNEIYYAVADRSPEQIAAFSERYDYISQKQIKSIFSHNGYSVLRMKKSKSWGTAHLVYFVDCKKEETKQRLVFRANAGEKGGFLKPEITMLSEKIITDAVRALWVATNNILHVDISRDNFPFDYQIEELLVWEDPERYLDDSGRFLWGKEAYDQMSYELWQAIAKYSTIKYAGYWIFDQEALKNGNIVWKHQDFYSYITTNLEIHLEALVWYGVIDTVKKQEILHIFQKHRDLINDCESCLVHHDLADHNIMYDPEKKWLGGIFDWEAMVLGDPMLDLGSCPTWGTHYPRKDLLIEGYKSIQQLPDDYELRMDLYELRTLIWKAMFVIRMNFWDEAKNSKIKKMNKVLVRLQG